ncbi:Mom family adenine methylcarbamoylation protein [Inquilinus sp. OTU3971]|uniref:Mom family adenine methylcarbamoylation protein n=1 Tax=Inquilinus sp. OTU3971 TaxID=3043855 RepID=UPI00313D3816
MGKRPAHHPAPAEPFYPPAGDRPDYILGADKAVLGFGSAGLYVALITRTEACEVIRANHYSGRVVANSYIHLGIWVGGERLGVLQLGYALNPRRVEHIVARTAVDEYLELNRMWLSDRAPRNSESQALAYAVRWLRRALPRIRWIQSFADERCGGWGVVYQAANYLYVGCHLSNFWSLDGEAFHHLLTTAHRDTPRGRYLAENQHRAVRCSYRQFRYIYFVKPSARRDLQMAVQAYPKAGQLMAA